MSGRSRSVSFSGPKKDALNINSKEKLPMEVWTSEIGLGIFASSLTSEKERGQGRKERKGRKATGQKVEGDKKEGTRNPRQKRKETRTKGKEGK